MRTSLIELFTRIITRNEKTNVFSNGIDNNYPERIERIINNSVTAKLSAGKMADYILGNGFSGDYNNPKVNTIKDYTLFDVGRLISKSISYQKGFYLHINYNAEGTLNYLDVLPYKECRISKEDDIGYKGCIFQSDKWGSEDFSFNHKNKESKWYYPYDPKINVINAQRRRDFKIHNKRNANNEDIEQVLKGYRGQVLFVNLEPEKIYPLSYVDVAYNDADSEYRSSVKNNNDIRNGFLDKTIITTLKADSEKEIKKIDSDIKDLLGEDGGNVWRVESEIGEDGKLIPVVDVQTIEASVDPKLFIETGKIIENNILNSFNGIPKVLAKSSDGALFGTNSETFIEAQKYYQKETKEERMVVEKTLNKIFGKKDEIKIVPLIEEIKQPTNGM